MGTGTIRSQPGLGHEENIGVKNRHATGENSSVDRNRISDFMGKRRVELHSYNSPAVRPFIARRGSPYSGNNADGFRSSRSNSTSPGRQPHVQRRLRSGFPSSKNHPYRAVGFAENKSDD